MKILILIIAIFMPSISTSHETSVVTLEKTYRELVIKEIKSSFKNYNKENNEYVKLLSLCSLAGLSAWPLNIRRDFLLSYKKSGSIKIVNNGLNISKMQKQYNITKETIFKYYSLNEIITSGCIKEFKSPASIKKLSNIGIKYKVK